MPDLFSLTDHAQRRCDQRGIRMADIELVATHGKVISRQGLLFHVMREKDIPRQLPAVVKGRVKHIVVVIPAMEPGLVLTVYRNANAMAHIKRKGKRLL